MAAAIAYEEAEEVEAARHEEERDEVESLSVASLEPSHSEPEARAAETPEATTAEILAASPQNQEEDVVEDEAEAEIHAGRSLLPMSLSNPFRNQLPYAGTTFNISPLPSEAPEGHTLEHEVLEDEEMEFHPVPDDISALSEVAGDEELVLEEETLDSDNGYSERWIPKIEDVDEDEVVAAEMRGENIYGAEGDERRRGRRRRAGGDQRTRRVARIRLLLRDTSSVRSSVRDTIAVIVTAGDAAGRAAVFAPVPTTTAINRSSPTC